MNRLILIVVGILTLLVMSFVPVSVHAQDAAPNLAVHIDHEEYVRNGPGTQFDLVGHLAAGTVMQVTSCNADCSWLEVAPAIWIAASQVTQVIASSQPNGTLGVLPPAAANAAAPLPIPTSVPSIVVGVNQNNTPSVTTQELQQIQLVSAQTPGMLEVATPVPLSAEVDPPTPIVLALANTEKKTATANRETQVYSGPGLSYPVIGNVVAGQLVTIVGVTLVSDWYQLAEGGWIATYVVDSLVSSNLVPAALPVVMQAAELPAAQPTSASIVAFTPVPPLLLASANAPLSQAPETPRAITTVIAPGIEVDGLKAKATSYNVAELTRNTENYIGHPVAYHGRVDQVLEDKALFSDQVTITLRIVVDDDYENMIAAKLVYKDGQGFRPLEDDQLTIWGTVEGREKYTDLQGAEETLPTVRILYLETESEQESTADVVSADGSTMSSSQTLKVLSHETHGSNNYLYIYGEVLNQSNYPVDGVKVVAVLRDANGNIVGTDERNSLLDTIPANGKSPFSIGFASWPGVTSYNIAVEGKRGQPNRQDLVIRSPNSTVEGSSLRIVGEVANTGTTPAQSVKVIITLYDNTGQVVGSDYAYKTLSTIAPGGTAAFSMSTSLPIDYSYYEIQVEGR